MARTMVPGPRGKWLVGDITAYQRDRIAWLTASREAYGDVVRLAPTIVVVHDAELAHQVLATTNDTFTVDSSLQSSRRQRRLIAANLDEWMRVRRDVWRGIAERITRLHIDRFTVELDADLRRHAGRTVDVVSVYRAILGRAIADFCIGGTAERPVLAAVCEAADNLFVSVLHALVSGEGRTRWWPRPAARTAVSANVALLAMLGTLVRERYAAPAPDEPRDLLDGLVADALSVDPPSVESTRRLVQVLRTIMFASHGVPGGALAWIALLLAEHPDAASAVAGEAASAPLTGSNLPFTTAFIKEALRLRPPQWLITRTSSAPVELDGYRLPAGTEVLVCPYLLHRDPRWWKDPDRFDPNRWLDRDSPHARHAYVPFGAGPRVCPGSMLAMVQLTIVTALLARDYRLDLPPLADVRAATDGLLLPAGLVGSWH